MEDEKQPSGQSDIASPSSKKSGGKLIVLIIAGIGCLVIICALVSAGIYFMLKGSNDDDVDKPDPVPLYDDVQDEDTPDQTSDDTDQTQDNNDQDTDDETESYVGDKITATVPDGWTIDELYDGEGSSMLPDGSYVGLTGVIVRNAGGQSVFRIQAVSGVGGIDICQTIYKFDDTEESYVTEYFNKTKDFNQSAIPPEDDPEIVDLSDEDYKEYELLGLEVRRIRKKIYFNMSSESGVFNPACGMFENLYSFPGLNFTYEYLGSSSTVDTYTVNFSNTIKNDELPLLDIVLGSMKVKGL